MVIKGALLKLWAFTEFGAAGEGWLEDAQAVLSRLENFATELLSSEAAAPGTLLFDVTIDLFGIENAAPPVATSLLREVLIRLGESPELSDGDRLDYLESQAVQILKYVKDCDNFGQAVPLMRALDRVTSLAARIAFTKQCDISQRMLGLIRDFDHGYDIELLKAIYLEVKRGQYRPGYL